MRKSCRLSCEGTELRLADHAHTSATLGDRHWSNADVLRKGYCRSVGETSQAWMPVTKLSLAMITFKLHHALEV